jgi:hypothetical protein
MVIYGNWLVVTLLRPLDFLGKAGGLLRVTRLTGCGFGF